MTQDSSPGRHTSAEPVPTQVPPMREPAGGSPGQFTGSEQPTPPSGTALPPTDVPAPASEHQPATTKVRRSRFGGLWVGLIVAAVILVLLLIFILQNSQSVQIDFIWMSGHAPLAVAILLGVAAGALLVAVPGTVRILQLRKSIRHR